MTAPGWGPGADGRVDRIGNDDGSDSIHAAPRSQAVPLVERHGPIPSDKVVLTEVVQINRLVGTWQGPGSILELSRRARR